MNDQVNVEKVNKSKLIVNVLKTKGIDTPANDVVDTVKKESGVEVTVSLVNNIRFRLRNEQKERKERREENRRRKEKVEKPVVVSVDDDMLSKLVAVREFANQFGGLDGLRILVDALDRLAA